MCCHGFPGLKEETFFYYFKKENPGCLRGNTKEEEAWAQGKLSPTRNTSMGR